MTRNLSQILVLLLALSGVVQCAGTGTTPRPARRSMDITTSQWAARDGKVMPFTKWPGETSRPDGVVICVHGLSGAASDFWPIGDRLPASNYAVYGLQLRGQGNDPDLRRRGDIRNRRQWAEDLTDFMELVKRRHRGVPVYWYGESLGALIALHTAAGAPPRAEPQAIILSSPVVALRENLQLGLLKNFCLRAALNFIPGTRVSLEQMGNSEVQVTSQTTHRHQMEHTAHYVPEFTLRLFAEIEQLIEHADEDAARIQVPVLVLYTPHDPLVSQEGVEQFFNRLGSLRKTKVFFPKSYHLILHDTERERALAVVRSWLDKGFQLEGK